MRRCERKIGELVREGQQEGTIRAPGFNQHTEGLPRAGDPPVPIEEVLGPSHEAQTQHMVLADAPDETFEEAIEEAKSEGNLSRANVVRKVKGEQPKSTTERSEWHHKKRHLDANRILRETALSLQSVVTGLDLLDAEQLDDEAEQWIDSIRQSMRTLGGFVRRVSR